MALYRESANEKGAERSSEKFHLIHSVDSPGLAARFPMTGVKKGVSSPVLLEVNISGESSKHGLPPDGWLREIESLLELEGLAIRGLMTMAPLIDDEKVIRGLFFRFERL